MTTFKNPHDPDNIVITGKVEEWVRAKMNLNSEISVQIVELNCMDPGCMDKETRISLSEQGQIRKQFRIHKPLVFVRKMDVDQSMKEI